MLRHAPPSKSSRLLAAILRDYFIIALINLNVTSSLHLIDYLVLFVIMYCTYNIVLFPTSCNFIPAVIIFLACDLATVDTCVVCVVDQIYHLASPASPPHYMYNPVKTIKTNTMGTINMLGEYDACTVATTSAQ